MLQRDRQNSPLAQAELRPADGDPWKSAGETRGNDQGVWILSYLDVMMILFAFFVLLFAYQKALLPSDKPSVKLSAASATSKATTNKPKKKTVAGSNVPAKNSAEPVVSTMRAQSALSSFSRQLPQEALRETNPVSKAVARDSVSAAARLTMAQSGQRIAQALGAEAQGNQVEVLTAGRGVQLELSEAILFDPASADLKGGGEALLERLLPVLQQQSGTLYVEGHTDNRPIASARFPSNWELSTARATAVTRYLIARGISSERIRAVGLADTQPRSGNDSAEARARNRRVTLVLADDQRPR